MGVNLFIDVYKWDAYANAGMKEIVRNNDKFPKIYSETNEDWWDVTFRPSDFQIWRNSMVEQGYNVDMWLKGLDFLEAHPDEWIKSSY